MHFNWRLGESHAKSLGFICGDLRNQPLQRQVLQPQHNEGEGRFTCGDKSTDNYVFPDTLSQLLWTLNLAVKYFCWNLFLTKVKREKKAGPSCREVAFLAADAQCLLVPGNGQLLWTKGHWLVIYSIKPSKTPTPQKGCMCRVLV